MPQSSGPLHHRNEHEHPHASLAPRHANQTPSHGALALPPPRTKDRTGRTGKRAIESKRVFPHGVGRERTPPVNNSTKPDHLTSSNTTSTGRRACRSRGQELTEERPAAFPNERSTSPGRLFTFRGFAVQRRLQQHHHQGRHPTASHRQPQKHIRVSLLARPNSTGVRSTCLRLNISVPPLADDSTVFFYTQKEIMSSDRATPIRSFQNVVVAGSPVPKTPSGDGRWPRRSTHSGVGSTPPTSGAPSPTPFRNLRVRTTRAARRLLLQRKRTTWGQAPPRTQPGCPPIQQASWRRA